MDLSLKTSVLPVIGSGIKALTMVLNELGKLIWDPVLSKEWVLHFEIIHLTVTHAPITLCIYLWLVLDSDMLEYSFSLRWKRVMLWIASLFQGLKIFLSHLKLIFQDDSFWLEPHNFWLHWTISSWGMNMFYFTLYFA